MLPLCDRVARSASAYGCGGGVEIHDRRIRNRTLSFRSGQRSRNPCHEAHPLVTEEHEGRQSVERVAVRAGSPPETPMPHPLSGRPTSKNSDVRTT